MRRAALSALGRHKLRTVLQALVLANLVVWLCVALFFYAWQSSVLESTRHDQEMAVSNLAQSLSQTINAELALVDSSLKHIGYHLDGAVHKAVLAPEDIDAVLQSQQELIPFVDALRMTDAQGNVLYGRGVDRTHPVNLGQQRIYAQVRASQDTDLLVSEPHVSPINHKWVVTLARKMLHRDGSFAGMLYATVGNDHFVDLFSSAQLGSHGAISLRTASLQLVARVAADASGPVAVGSSQVSAELALALKRAPLFGVYNSPTALDGIERLNAYCRVLNFPMLVIAGQGLEVFQGPWLKQLSQIGFLCFLCMLALGLMSVLAYGAIRRELRARDAMEREVLHSRQLLEASSDGIHVLNDAGVLVQCNAMFAEMLGYRDDFLQGRALAFWTDLPLSALVAPGRVDARYRKSDGSLVDVDVSFSHMPSPLGNLTYCSARDITARKAVEQALLHKSALLQALGQASQSACLVVQHRNDAIQYFNHRFCVLWNLEHLEPSLEAGKLSYSQLLLAMHPQLANPQEFLASRVVLEDELQAHTLQDTIAFTQQRLVRRFTTAVRDVHGALVGRLYTFDEVPALP